MQQHSKEWLGQRAREILERNASCNKGATSTKNRATNVVSECCTERGVFKFWLADDEHPGVMIAGSASIEDAEQSLQVTFGGRVTRVERLKR